MKGLMRKIFAILAGTVFLHAGAQAGIGETEKQVRARYGDPITALPARTAGITNCYSSKGLLIAITFLHGRSVREMITKTDRTKISDAELQKLLMANATDRSSDSPALTGPMTVTPGVQEWRSADRKSRVAIYDSHSRALFITTQKFIDLTNAQKRAVAFRADPGGRGARGRPEINLRALQRDAGVTALPGQAKPAASPAK